VPRNKELNEATRNLYRILAECVNGGDALIILKLAIRKYVDKLTS
jgi:hypothetical protein